MRAPKRSITQLLRIHQVEMREQTPQHRYHLATWMLTHTKFLQKRCQYSPPDLTVDDPTKQLDWRCVVRQHQTRGYATAPFKIGFICTQFYTAESINIHSAQFCCISIISTKMRDTPNRRQLIFISKKEPLHTMQASFEELQILEDGFIKMTNSCFNTNFTDITDALAHYKSNAVPAGPRFPINAGAATMGANTAQLFNSRDSEEEQEHDSFYIAERKRKAEAYSWTRDMHERFVVVCVALGIRECKPKDVLQYFGHFDGIEKAVIGSHLQKVRKAILKDQGLQNLADVQNWMAPKDVHDETLTFIVQKWKEPGFTGFSSAQISQLVREK
ncbi:Conserved_hypothetical protein [Hexamita inflata]|uniref:Uncharacterized protein n=1 Tax=Hexamita inflata TaxID=28002 RepID=A0ABP1I718_9EUKA